MDCPDVLKNLAESGRVASVADRLARRTRSLLRLGKDAEVRALVAEAQTELDEAKSVLSALESCIANPSHVSECRA